MRDSPSDGITEIKRLSLAISMQIYISRYYQFQALNSRRETVIHNSIGNCEIQN